MNRIVKNTMSGTILRIPTPQVFTAPFYTFIASIIYHTLNTHHISFNSIKLRQKFQYHCTIYTFIYVYFISKIKINEFNLKFWLNYKFCLHILIASQIVSLSFSLYMYDNHEHLILNPVDF